MPPCVLRTFAEQLQQNGSHAKVRQAHIHAQLQKEHAAIRVRNTAAHY